jgi:hypothetical protein
MNARDQLRVPPRIRQDMLKRRELVLDFRRLTCVKIRNTERKCTNCISRQPTCFIALSLVPLRPFYIQGSRCRFECL